MPALARIGFEIKKKRDANDYSEKYIDYQRTVCSDKNCNYEVKKWVLNLEELPFAP